MRIFEYPLLYWKIKENLLLGQLVGSNKQLVADDVRSLKAGFTEYIEKQLRDGYFHQSNLTSLRHKRITMSVRPHFKENDKIFPIIETLEVPVDAVYGKTPEGYFECFLPLLQKNFFFYSEADITKLIEHFSKDVLHSLHPSSIYRLLLPDAPSLDLVQAKELKPKKNKSTAFDFSTDFQTLVGIAEKLPYKSGENRSLLPDVAWEQGKLIDELKEYVIEDNLNVLIVGKSGVGKSTIIKAMIREVTTSQKNNTVYERNTFWRSAPARIVAKAKYLGEWQMICEDLIYELERANGILWLENFVSLIFTGGEGAEDSMAAFMLSFIKQGRLRMVSEISPEQLEAMRRVFPSFVEYFRIIKIEEMNRSTTLRLFNYYQEHSLKHHKINFTRNALETSYILLDRFVRYDSFPGKAMRFLQKCTTNAQLKKQTELDTLDVINIFSEQSGIPDFLLRDDVLLDEEVLNDFFRERIKGQDHIITKIISLIKVFKAGLNDPNKPVATMIFAGPTGVGKTATAKAISEYFFGMGQQYRPLIRLDMSEFQHAGQIYRLIGSEGKLVQHVRQKPFGVVLLDEIEKANPLIFDALLTVLDEGILLDSAGRMTDFRNTIIIMTSNLGTTQRSSLGFKQYQGQDFEADIKAFFRPEFYNRIDSCLIFNPLDEQTIKEITYYELQQIEQREGLRQRGLKLYFTEALIAHIATQGFDKKYGARPLQREIERLIVAPLARKMMQSTELKNQKITVDVVENEVVFTV